MVISPVALVVVSCAQGAPAAATVMAIGAGSSAVVSRVTVAVVVSLVTGAVVVSCAAAVIVRAAGTRHGGVHVGEDVVTVSGGHLCWHASIHEDGE